MHRVKIKRCLKAIAQLAIGLNSDGDSAGSPGLEAKWCLNWAFWLWLGSTLLILPVLSVFCGLILLWILLKTSSISGSMYFGVQYSRYWLYIKYFGGQYARYWCYLKYFGFERSEYFHVLWDSILRNTALLELLWGSIIWNTVCT